MVALTSSAVASQNPVINPVTGQKAGEGRTVVVFGGSGFIGRYLVPLLARDGWAVRVAVRSPEKAAFLKTAGDVGQISPLACDLSKPEMIARAVSGADVVVNLVGILFESGSQTFSALQEQGPGRIASAARASGVSRFVQMSAIGADPDSGALYASSKGRGEQAVHDVYPDASIVRPSVVFGREDGFYNRFADMLPVSPFLPLVGGGKTLFQPVFVGDVAEALRRCVNHPECCGGKTYELGGPDVWSFRACLEYLLRVTGKRRLLLNLPFSVAKMQAFFMEFLPVPPLTRDQVTMLHSDNVVSPDAPDLEDLGIAPTSMQAIVPEYICR
ncbi:complex I NDUFA9 subunit family protein [Kiloniella sp. b19]|uniref:complex I NDUFA9 subunit family protein n=1 Tax=Kiloniella sp. GXU_MW_B19 TaxID=3141326 RepID=UPI0031D56B23